MLYPIILAIFPFVVVVVTHIIYCRQFGRRSTRSLQNVLGGMIIAGNFILLAELVSSTGSESAVEGMALWSYCFIAYNALMYAYFHFFNMSETARRIHILLKVLDRVNLGEGELIAAYSPRDMVLARLERLVKMGWLKVNEEGQYNIGAQWALHLAQCFSFARRILGFTAMNKNQ